MTDYKTIYIAQLIDKGFSLDEAEMLQKEVWSGCSRYTQGARDEAAMKASVIYNGITNPINNPITHPKRILFKGKRLSGMVEPSDDDVCVICGMTHKESIAKYGRRLCLHHDEYIVEDPLACTRWMCCSCHTKYHAEQSAIEEGA